MWKRRSHSHTYHLSSQWCIKLYNKVLGLLSHHHTKLRKCLNSPSSIVQMSWSAMSFPVLGVAWVGLGGVGCSQDLFVELSIGLWSVSAASWASSTARAVNTALPADRCFCWGQEPLGVSVVHLVYSRTPFLPTNPLAQLALSSRSRREQATVQHH